jgi:hypothetical protein
MTLQITGDDPDKKDDCGTCGMGSAIEDDKCSKSQRPCGHHCNHVWTHDTCDWCGNNFEV